MKNLLEILQRKVEEENKLKPSDRFKMRILQDAKLVSTPKKKKEDTDPKSWPAKPSEYFGKRSNIITANLPDGSTKRMKLKNALKHGYSFA